MADTTVAIPNPKQQKGNPVSEESLDKSGGEEEDSQPAVEGHLSDISDTEIMSDATEDVDDSICEKRIREKQNYVAKENETENSNTDAASESGTERQNKESKLVENLKHTEGDDGSADDDEQIDSDGGSPPPSYGSAKDNSPKRDSIDVDPMDAKSESDADDEDDKLSMQTKNRGSLDTVEKDKDTSRSPRNRRLSPAIEDVSDEHDESESENKANTDDAKKNSLKEILLSSKEKVGPVKKRSSCRNASTVSLRKESPKKTEDQSNSGVGKSDDNLDVETDENIEGDDEKEKDSEHSDERTKIETSHKPKEILEDDNDDDHSGDVDAEAAISKDVNEDREAKQAPIVVKVCTFVDSEEEEVADEDNIGSQSLKSKKPQTSRKGLKSKRKDDSIEETRNPSEDESRSSDKKAVMDGKGGKGEASEESKGKENKVFRASTMNKRTAKHKKADKVKTKDCKSDGKEKGTKAEVNEMSTLAILDVRTVVDDEQSSNDKNTAGKKKKSKVAKESGTEEEEIKEEGGEDASNDDSSGSHSSRDVADKQSSDKPSGIEAIAHKLTEKSKQSTEDNEMKNYAADTMNELLGLFGYEKVDDRMKDAIQLSNNLAGPSNSAASDDKTSTEKDKNTVASPVKNEVADKDTAANSSPKDEEMTDISTKDEQKDEEAPEKKVTKATSVNATVKTTQGRQCSVCEKTRSCKYQVLMLGTTKFLCDDNCFREFRTKQNITTAPAIKDIIAENRPITRSLTNPKDHCNVCHKEIKNGMGLLPGVGENKPLCSEECMKNYQATQGLKRACAQCGNHIQSRSKCLTWEAMEFCNEECLGKYQSYLGSHCAYCNNAVQQTSLGKYCVRFGSDIKQFCSNSCLEEFKKGLKVCSYCQKDISTGTEGFLAPVGDKGQFKEFCSQSCMEKYETMGSITPSQPTIEQCSVCNKVTSVKVEVTFEGKVHKLCSEPCIAAFRYANKINTSICDTCHKFFNLDVNRQLTIQFEGTSKRFCTKACMNVFVLYHRKVVPCSWCKVKKYNFDMIERVDSNNHVQLFCSLNCLSLFRVSLNATSSRRIQCDFCHQVKPAQYHLTMSDASIRNFCSYNCVMQFQSQFTSVAQVVTPPQTTRTTTNTQTAGTPVISSVMSLAPSHTQTSTTQTTQKSVVVRSPAVPTLPVAKSTILKTTYTQTVTPVITQQVVIKQPPAKPQKNKMLMCRPQVQTKGVSCKPHPCHKVTQTDEDYHSKPIFIPVPVPIYVPVPMRMYTTPVPFPLAFPLPIPVPVFIPTTKNSAHSIFKQIKEIQQKIPDNPFEADLILMAEMVAEDSAAAKDKQAKRLTEKPAEENQENSNAEAPEAPSGSPKQEEGFIVEPSLPDSCPASNTFGDDVLQMALRMASTIEESVGLDSSLSNEQSLSGHSQDLNQAEGNGDYLSPRELRGQARNHKRSGSRVRGRGRKRARMDETIDNNVTPTQTPPPVQAPVALVSPLSTQFDFRPIGPPQIESNCVLKYSYGVNAWKHWVLQKNTQLEKASQTNRKLKLFKTDILQLSADELNYSLCLFVKEVRKPNGDEYAPDSIYYLCLGIQQYLFENGRIDNIFSDAYYEKFTECLNEVLQRYEVTLTSEGYFLSRIEEEILWECKQLGAHSPHVLLNTLMYFNTKYFMLKSVDDHLQLSFSHILKHWKKTPGSSCKGSAGGRNVLLRYYPPSQMKDSPRRRKESIPSYEQVENLDNPLRCPVKLYEFYLSKCPESIKNRSDIFYLYPERSCVPDSPVWYSTMPLGKDTIAKMLQRIRMVREVGEAAINNS